jgi:hypothetical protein
MILERGWAIGPCQLGNFVCHRYLSSATFRDASTGAGLITYWIIVRLGVCFLPPGRMRSHRGQQLFVWSPSKRCVLACVFLRPLVAVWGLDGMDGWRGTTALSRQGGIRPRNLPHSCRAFTYSRGTAKNKHRRQPNPQQLGYPPKALHPLISRHIQSTGCRQRRRSLRRAQLSFA